MPRCLFFQQLLMKFESVRFSFLAIITSLAFNARFRVLEPIWHEAVSFCGRLYCTERALWKLGWFLGDFAYDTELLSRDQVDEKSPKNLRGVVRTTFTSLNGHAYQNLISFAPAGEWEAISSHCQ